MNHLPTNTTPTDMVVIDRVTPEFVEAAINFASTAEMSAELNRGLVVSMTTDDLRRFATTILVLCKHIQSEQK